MKLIATKNHQSLPDIDALKRLLQSLAVLDMIMSPEWDYRYYSFDSQWSEGETMGAMRNGCGDSFNILFNSSGSFIKGCAHDYPLSSWLEGNLARWKTALKTVPNEFSSALGEPAFDMDSISFCYWRTTTDKLWQCTSIEMPEPGDPDGAQFLLEILDSKPGTYQSFVEKYYEQDIPLSPIKDVYCHTPMTQDIINLLNPEVKLADIQTQLLEIGYPVGDKIMLDS
ncbi:MAG: hypothetical protein HRT35_23180 [Algicola sp.]|nr:hypothetical protein [Algicola sp.]